MVLRKIIYIKIFLLSLTFTCFAQNESKPKMAQMTAKSSASAIKSSSAYAELLLRRTERESELEELLLDYTEEFPKVKELRFESNLIQKELDKILTVNSAETGKLTLALGKMMIRKVELEVELWNLKRQYSDEQPEVKRTKRKIEVFDKAIKEILS